jgi:hypothetical protein
MKGTLTDFSIEYIFQSNCLNCCPLPEKKNMLEPCKSITWSNYTFFREYMYPCRLHILNNSCCKWYQASLIYYVYYCFHLKSGNMIKRLTESRVCVWYTIIHAIYLWECVNEVMLHFLGWCATISGCFHPYSLIKLWTAHTFCIS